MNISAAKMENRITHSTEETFLLGSEWGRCFRPGTIIGIKGDLGAGKTHLVKGIAAGLGIEQKIHSPTFILVQSYFSGRIPLHHLDLYRLNDAEEIRSSGLEEYFFKKEAVTVVEWFDRWSPEMAIPNPALFFRRVFMESLTEASREIKYEDFGS